MNDEKQFFLKMLEVPRETLGKIEKFDGTITKILVRIDEFKSLIESQTEQEVANNYCPHIHTLSLIMKAYDHIQKPLFKGLCNLLVDDDAMCFLINGDVECKCGYEVSEDKQP